LCFCGAFGLFSELNGCHFFHLSAFLTSSKRHQ
jgi:hypothetical protein